MKQLDWYLILCLLVGVSSDITALENILSATLKVKHALVV